MDAGAPCGHPPCILGVQSPSTRGKFFAMAGFYVVYDFFKLQLTATLPELEASDSAAGRSRPKRCPIPPVSFRPLPQTPTRVFSAAVMHPCRMPARHTARAPGMRSRLSCQT